MEKARALQILQKAVQAGAPVSQVWKYRDALDKDVPVDSIVSEVTECEWEWLAKHTNILEYVDDIAAVLNESIPRWRTERENLFQKGIYAIEVTDSIRKLGAQLRHERRKKVVRIVSVLATGDAFLAAGISWLEGQRLFGNIRRSQREFPFALLGKGRRNATDGPSWTAAIGSAWSEYECKWVAIDKKVFIEVKHALHFDTKQFSLLDLPYLLPVDKANVALFVMKMAHQERNEDLFVAAALTAQVAFGSIEPEVNADQVTLVEAS